MTEEIKRESNKLTQEFLSAFKDIETFIVDLARTKTHDDYITFSRALTYVFKFKLNYAISKPYIYNFLKTCADIRNILSHNNDFVVPSEEVVKNIKIIAAELNHPVLIKDIATKGSDLLVCGPNSNIRNVVERMAGKGLSHVPILVNNKVVGIFSNTSFFQKYHESKNLVVEDDMRVLDFEDISSSHRHLSEEFIFVSNDTKVEDIIGVFSKKRGEKRVACIFVTTTGDSFGDLLGIVTETDLLKIADM